MHCVQLILRKISKLDATRCQILRLKCTKFDFRWLLPIQGLQLLLQQQIQGLYIVELSVSYCFRLQRSPDPLAAFNGAYF